MGEADGFMRNKSQPLGEGDPISKKAIIKQCNNA